MRCTICQLVQLALFIIPMFIIAWVVVAQHPLGAAVLAAVWLLALCASSCKSECGG
jgi:hypothetical protein